MNLSDLTKDAKGYSIKWIQMDSNVPSVQQWRRISSSGLPSFRTTKRHLTLKVGCRPGCIFSLWLKWTCFTPANNLWAKRNKIILNLLFKSLKHPIIRPVILSSQCSSLCVLPQAINLSQSLSNLSPGPTRNPTHPFTCRRLFGCTAMHGDVPFMKHVPQKW